MYQLDNSLSFYTDADTYIISLVDDLVHTVQYSLFNRNGLHNFYAETADCLSYLSEAVPALESSSDSSFVVAVTASVVSAANAV